MSLVKTLGQSQAIEFYEQPEWSQRRKLPKQCGKRQKKREQTVWCSEERGPPETSFSAASLGGHTVFLPKSGNEHDAITS